MVFKIGHIMFDMQWWTKRAGRMNTKTEANKKGGKENKHEMIGILAKDVGRHLGMITVKRG